MSDAKAVGFFVDWDGNTRRTEAPGDGYECNVDLAKQHVDVVDSAGFVVHECTYFPTIESLKQADIDVNLI